MITKLITSPTELRGYIAQLESISKETPNEDWAKIDSPRERIIYNYHAGKQRGTNIHENTIRDYLRTRYSELIMIALDIHPDGDLSEDKEWNEFQDMIGLMYNQMRGANKVIPGNDALLISLWKYIEEDGIEFGMGDDGTDETEQDLMLLYQLSNIYNSLNNEDARDIDLIHTLADWSLKYEMNIDDIIAPCQELYLNMPEQEEILKRIYNYYKDEKLYIFENDLKIRLYCSYLIDDMGFNSI